MQLTEADRPDMRPHADVELTSRRCCPCHGRAAGGPGAAGNGAAGAGQCWHCGRELQSATALAKKLQNPIGDLYSFPFQNNTNFNFGPHKGTQDILNIQPVIPIHLTEDWNVITRTILPLIWQPSLQPAHTCRSAPARSLLGVPLAGQAGEWLALGRGPVIQMPTISSADARLQRSGAVGRPACWST